MPAIPDDVLDAAQSLLNDEFNQGEDFSTSPVEPAGAREDTPELKVDAQGRAHGPDGKFVPLEESVEEATEEEVEETPEAVAEEEQEEAPEAPAEEETEDDFLELDLDHPFFSKYGGDPDKALKALEEAQRKIGEQGNELGQHRQENEQLKALVDRLAALETQMVPYQNDPEENPQGVIEEVVARFAQTGVFDDVAYEQAIAAWGDDDPLAAARVDARITMARAQVEQMSPVGQEPVSHTTLDTEMAALKQRHPDVVQFLPAIQEIVAERPVWQQAISQGDPRARAQAFEDLYLLARSQGPTPATSAEAKKVLLRVKAEADKAKADAAVVSARNTSAAKQGPTGNQLLQETLRDLSGLDDLEIV